MFEYKPGMSLSDPWPFTVTRASTAYRFANDGTVKQVAANVLRDNHYPFGLGSSIRTTLFEPTVVNRCLQSQALATAPWSAANMTSVTNNAATAPDGTVTATLAIPNGTNTTQHALAQSITITANENLAVSMFVKAAGYTAIQLQFDDNGPQTNVFKVSFDLLAGTAGTLHSAAGTGASIVGWTIVPLANGWYWIGGWGVLGNALVTGRIIPFVYDTIAHANAGTAFSGDGVSGIYFWGAQVERNGTLAPKAASSYVPTAGAAATRNDEKCSTPWPFQTQAMWGYTSWYDLGGSIWLQSAPLVTISNAAANPDPSWCPMFLRNNGKPGASWGSGVYVPPNTTGMLGSNRNTIAAAAGLAAVQPYDFVETFSRVLKDGSTWFDARINGGAVITNGPIGPTGAIPFADIINALLYLGWPGQLTGPQVGLTCVRIGADPTRTTTLALAAAA